MEQNQGTTITARMYGALLNLAAKSHLWLFGDRDPQKERGFIGLETRMDPEPRDSPIFIEHGIETTSFYKGFDINQAKNLANQPELLADYLKQNMEGAGKYVEDWTKGRTPLNFGQQKMECKVIEAYHALMKNEGE